MGWLRLSPNHSTYAGERTHWMPTPRGLLVAGLALTLAMVGVLSAAAAGPATLLTAAYDNATGTLTLDISGADAAGLDVRLDGQPVATSGLTAVPVGSQGSVILAIETSSSTAGAVLNRQRAVARALIEALPPQAQVAIVTFDDSARTVSPLGTDRAGTLEALNALTTGSGAALYDGVEAAAALASAGSIQPHSIVLMTYGWHFGSDRVTRGASIEAARASGATVHAFAFGSDFDSPYLTSLAGTDGSFDSRPQDAAGTSLASRVASTVYRVQIPVKLAAGAHSVALGDGPSANAVQFSVAAAGAAPAQPKAPTPGTAPVTPPVTPDAPALAEPTGFSSWAPVFSAIGLIGALATAYLLLRGPSGLRRTPVALQTSNATPDPEPTPPPPAGPQGPDGGERAATTSWVSTVATSLSRAATAASSAASSAGAGAAAAASNTAGRLRGLRSSGDSPRVPTVAAQTTHTPVHMSTDGRISRGLRRLNLGVRYQPVFSIETGELVGAEALLRAESDTAASMTARAVVRMATAQGQMPEITGLVVGDACRVAALMTEAGTQDFRVSVNVSVEQLLDRGFTSALRTALGEARLAPSQLAIEVAEHGLVENARAVAVLADAALLGVRTVVDDFWASDPALLAQLPSGSSAKVDVSRVGGSARAEQELRRIVSAAREANMPVTAKRVESKEDRAFALSLGCQFAQGNQFSEPVTGVQLLAIAAPLAELNRIAESFGDHPGNGGSGPGGESRRVA